MVSLAESNQGSDDMVTGGFTVVKGLVTEPMSEGVDTECGLLDEEDAEDTGVDKSAPPVTPAKTSNKHGNHQPHNKDEFDVVAVLPDNHRVPVEIGDIGATNALRVLFHDHPAKMRV